MGRYKPDRTVHADWWDADEHATFYGTLGFLPAQRIAYHVGASQEITPASDEDVQRMVRHMAAALVESLVPSGWTLKDRQGQLVPLTAEDLAGLPTQDIAYLFKEAFPADPTLKAQPDGTVAYEPAGLISAEAMEAGLTPEVFPTTPN